MLQFSKILSCINLSRYRPNLSNLIDQMSSTTTIFLVFLVSISLCQGEKLVVEEKDAPKLPKLKQTQLRFYIKEDFTGPDPTGVVIAQAASTNSSSTQFGLTYTFDNPLTLDLENTTDVVGRSQGFFSLTSKETLSATVLMTLIFNEEKFNGSSLVVAGRVDSADGLREIPVIGGSGVFKFATGYCDIKPIDIGGGIEIPLYNIYVRHYY